MYQRNSQVARAHTHTHTYVRTCIIDIGSVTIGPISKTTVTKILVISREREAKRCE